MQIANMIINLILTATVLAYVCWKVHSRGKFPLHYDAGTPPKFFITGDKHQDFYSVRRFCRDMKTRRKDVLIILSDAGFNCENFWDDRLKNRMSKLNITLFCVQGKKEKRPRNVGAYRVRSFCGGKVYYEPKYPNIFFAIDGEVYTFEGKKYMAVGGAHSADKIRRLEEGQLFWKDAMPDDATKAKVEERLGKLEQLLDYELWYWGHYHTGKQIDKVSRMCDGIRPLHMRLFGEE